jgi:iron(II)-dependent oxidoreductase
MRPATAESLAEHLLESRRAELALLEGIPDDCMLGRNERFLEPPIWEMGHVGWFQEKWILRNLDRTEPLWRDGDGIYDAFHVSYKLRWEHDFPSRTRTRAYLDEVLRRAVGRLRDHLSEEETYYYTLAALHEDMHTENLAVIMQTLGMASPLLCGPRASLTAPDEAYVPHDVEVPGGAFVLGAPDAERFVFDNELCAHPMLVQPFVIASTPVTNAQFAEFVADGGYRRRELWRARGWYWLSRAGIEHPLFWQREPGGAWAERRFDRDEALDPWAPVVGVCWHEADAFARWARRRLPTEAEWEMAATFDPATGAKRRFPWGDAAPSPELASLDFRAGWPVDVRAHAAGDSPAGCRQMIGNVWEWVADTFRPYPGFVAGPYREYSEPYFGSKKVLRGGCWTTRSALIRPAYRNFFLPHRRNLFAGFRTAVA